MEKDQDKKCSNGVSKLSFPKTRILIIAEPIVPLQSIGAIRWTKLAKYLKKEKDVTITVLTNEKNFGNGPSCLPRENFDTFLENDLKYIDNYWTVPVSKKIKLYYSLKKLSTGKVAPVETIADKTRPRGSLKVDIKNFLFYIKNILLSIDSQKYFQQKMCEFDVVISTFGPIWPYLAAKKIKAAQPNIIWLADFRDPSASETDGPLSYKWHQKAAMKHCATADYVLRAADTLATFTPQHIPIYTITNGFDLEEKLPQTNMKKFRIVLTGKIYGNRSEIGIVCKAVKSLCDEGKIEEKDIEVSYAGPHGEMAKLLVENYDATEYLHDYGLLSRYNALQLQQNAAILLQAAWNTKLEKCLWTGKVYEYMMAEKPIIYVVTGDEPYSEPSKYIHLLGGYCYEQCRHEETYQGMKDYILEKYQEWKTTGNVTVQQDKEYIEQFAYPHIAEQVWQLIQEGMKKKDESRIAEKN